MINNRSELLFHDREMRSKESNNYTGIILNKSKSSLDLEASNSFKFLNILLNLLSLSLRSLGKKISKHRILF